MSLWITVHPMMKKLLILQFLVLTVTWEKSLMQIVIHWQYHGMVERSQKLQKVLEERKHLLYKTMTEFVSSQYLKKVKYTDWAEHWFKKKLKSARRKISYNCYDIFCKNVDDWIQQAENEHKWYNMPGFSWYLDNVLIDVVKYSNQSYLNQVP